MLGIIAAIKEGLAIVNNLTSGENSEKRLHVAMRKNSLKALDVAEDYFDLVEENMDQLPKSVQGKLKKLSKKFDDLD